MRTSCYRPVMLLRLKPRTMYHSTIPPYSSIWPLMAALLLASLLMACKPAGPPVDLELPSPTLDALPQVRVSAQNPPQTEWRDAAAFEPGQTRIALGRAIPGTAIRIGLLDTAGAPVSVNVISGNGVAHALVSPAKGTWTDWRLPLDANNADVLVEFSSTSAYWISTVEIVPPNPPATPNVIVVLVDTLRRDHLGAYGYHRPTSPNIDAFAQESIRFDHFVPASSWTRPSVASLMTSTVPTVHGGEDMGDHLREGLPWMGEAFQKAGFETRALMTNPNCLPIWGFGGGFSRYVDVGSDEWLQQDDSVVMQQAAAAVRDLSGRPFFLYVHTLAPHEPYTPPEPYRSDFASPVPADGTAPLPHQVDIDLYDAEIRYFDTLFGEFVAMLKETGVYDSSIIVFLSDHGQAFGEHGHIGHGSSLYEEQMNPPLIVRLPAGAHGGRAIGSLVEMIDIAPTLAALAGVDTDPRFQGASFVPLLEGGSWDKTLAYASLQHRDLSQYMSRTVETKYIRNVKENRDEWFNLAADPQELHPLNAPAANADLLRAHLEQMTSLGQSGLHILITHDSSKPLAVAGEIRAAGLGEARLDYPEERSALQPGADAVRFTADMPGATEGDTGSARLAEAMDRSQSLRNLVALNGEAVPMEQDYVLFTAHVPMDAEVAITLTLDGAPIPADQVHFAAARGAQPLDGRPVPMAEMLGSSVAFNPAALPVRTAAYVWYVPSAEQISSDQLTAEMRESLRALGYVPD